MFRWHRVASTLRGGTPMFATTRTMTSSSHSTLYSVSHRPCSSSSAGFTIDASDDAASTSEPSALGGLEFVTESGLRNDDDAYDIGLREVVDSGERPEMNAALYLCEELLGIRRSVLKNFVRAKRKARGNGRQAPNEELFTGGKRWNPSTECVLELIHHASEEVQGNYGFRNTERKLGKVNPEARSAMQSREWTEEGLEAVHLEHACKKAVESDLTQSPQMVLRRHGRLVKRFASRLSKAVFDEFESASIAAVGGVHRTYREEAADIIRTVNPKELVSVFCTFLSKYIMYVRIPTFLSDRLMVPEILADVGILLPPRTEDTVVTLSRMMAMLDDAEAEVNALLRADVNLYNRDKESATNMVATMRRFRLRASTIDAASDAPAYIAELVTQFEQWEALVRNDVPDLRDADPIVFDIILSAVSILRTMRKVFPVHFEPEHRLGIAKKYIPALKEAIIQQYGEEKGQRVLSALNTYTCVGTTEQTLLSKTLFDAIDSSHLEATLTNEGLKPNNVRTAIALREVANLATRAPKCSGLFNLMITLTQEMCFHLRFRKIAKKMTPKQRMDALQATRLWQTLEHYENVFKVTPPSVKSVTFMTTIFLYLLAHSRAGGVTPMLTRFTSTSGCDELSVLALGSSGADAPIDVHISHPPQLKPHSWSDAGSEGIYRMMPSRPVVGTMSDVFMKTRPPMLRALDAVSKVPWKVSKYILHVQERILVDGYGHHKIQASFHPLSFASVDNGTIPCAELAEKGIHLQDRLQRRIFTEQKENDLKSLREVNAVRIHYLMAMRTARNLASKSEIYFPHKLDFRGRMYPIVGRFNHTGSDPFRALIEFATPVPLGKEGLYWLKVHLANLMGMNKLTYDERVQYIDNHVTDVVQSAEDPLGGDRWWQEGDEPVQALLACNELANALKYSQGAENFPSTVPVHVDGSCNGLQHYSAIGRDEYGGRLVNLVPSERPQDVYNGILNEVINAVKRDAAADNEVALRCLGTGNGVDKNHLRRKTIKRAVMTQVYGVTYYGMSEMIRQELQNQNQSHQLWTSTAITEMAAYIRDRVIESLGVTFSQAQKARTWLDTVTTIIWRCQPQGMRQPFQWVTPLGLIVRQPYLSGSHTMVYTPAGAVKIDTGAVTFASRSQLTALPPNLIHSLDAVHLAMTALEMDKLGLPMVAVHDSFWCHAAHLPQMSKILREEFRNLYTSYDPLWELKEQWEEQFFTDLRRHNVRLPDPPSRGTLDLEKVKDSPYFFG
eukprot:PhM_4_TR8224/c0_g1_i1/m.5814/K10908/POLRMT, RPO41; DNA-directed RNA polymerase, mitochondrial